MGATGPGFWPWLYIDVLTKSLPSSLLLFKPWQLMFIKTNSLHQANLDIDNFCLMLSLEDLPFSLKERKSPFSNTKFTHSVSSCGQVLSPEDPLRRFLPALWLRWWSTIDQPKTVLSKNATSLGPEWSHLTALFFPINWDAAEDQKKYMLTRKTTNH